MHIYLHILGVTIPSYGFFITLGVILANLIAVVLLRRKKQNFYDFVLLESYCFLGAFLGAKILYLIVCFQDIEWEHIMNLQYFDQIMSAGFVFYGGLIGGLIFTFGAGYLYKITVIEYVQDYIFLIPFIHAFGRVGCFMAGCCYGVPYSGFGAVVFPEDSCAISGISLFPVQLVEAFLLMLLAIFMLYLQLYKYKVNNIMIYIGSYSVIRFFLEYLRYDEKRGKIGFLSTSQCISLCLISIVIGLHIMKRKRKL